MAFHFKASDEDNMVKISEKHKLFVEKVGNTVLLELLSSDLPLELMEKIIDIVEYEYGKHIGKFIEKEWHNVKLKHELRRYKYDHTNALELLIQTETQKLELEALKNKIELLNHELEALSFSDALTGIPNRRHFDYFIELAWGIARRQKKTVALIMIDIDYFKQYNDYYGHQKGDECLKNIAQAINQFGRRSTDIVARYGGEEFVVVLSDINKANLLMIAEKIRTRVREQNIPHERSIVDQMVTISLGLSLCVPDKNNSLEILIRAADQALYQAKRNGRNQLEFFDIIHCSE